MDRFVKNPDVEKTKREIVNFKKDRIFIVAQNDHYNRKIIEHGKFYAIIDIEKGYRKDNLRQLDSGLNSYLAKEAVKKEISLCLDINEIRNLKVEEKAIRLARIMQNIKLCKKTGTPVKLMNVKDKKDAVSFLVSLGASTEQASKAISF